MTLEGKFIVFEGTDGVGKTTQVSILTEHLSKIGYSVLQVCTPSNFYREDEHVVLYNKTGSGLLTPTTLAVMSAADRLRTYDTTIKPHLDSGGTVVCDRYKFSAEAYFAMRGADIPLLREIHDKLPNPNHAILLTIDALTRQARLRKRATTEDWEEQDMRYQDTVQNMIRDGWRKEYSIIDAGQSIEDVSSKINDYLGIR